MIKMSRPFRLLIGDDSFDEPSVVGGHMALILCGMRDIALGKVNLSTSKFRDGVYRVDAMPMERFQGFEARVLDDWNALIEEGSTRGGEYDWIVSDLDYSYRKGEEGITAMRNIPQYPGVVRAIFTSGTDRRRLRILKGIAEGTLVDYFIAPALGGCRLSGDGVVLTKPVALGRTIARHYPEGGQ